MGLIFTYVGSLGVAEMIAGLSARHDDVAFLQQEDLRALGGLLLQLLCGSSTHASLDQVSAHSSPELTHVVASLTGHSEPLTSWHQVPPPPLLAFPGVKSLQ